MYTSKPHRTTTFHPADRAYDLSVIIVCQQGCTQFLWVTVQGGEQGNTLLQSGPRGPGDLVAPTVAAMDNCNGHVVSSNFASCGQRASHPFLVIRNQMGDFKIHPIFCPTMCNVLPSQSYLLRIPTKKKTK